MKGKVVLLPNAKRAWEARIFSVFSRGNDVDTLHQIQAFYRLHPKKNTLHLLASFCHYRLGEEAEARRFIQEMEQIQAVPYKQELYDFYQAVFGEADFWPWYVWLSLIYKEGQRMEWLEAWFVQIKPPQYKLLRNVNQLQPKASPFVERFSQIFLSNQDTQMQLAWLKSNQYWEKSDFFLEACQTFFLKDSAHPFVQTMLLQQLKFEQVSYDFQIKKSGRIGYFDLEKMDFPLLSLKERKIIQEIQNYEGKNISYAQQMLQIYQQYVMYFYPFVTEYPPEFVDMLVCYTNEAFGEKTDLTALTDTEKQIYQELVQANQPIFSF